jgi:multicomponent Na+:H+ antiporter subunit F
VGVATILLVAALVLGIWRLVSGPSGADRIMALDLLTGSAMATTVFLSIRFEFPVFLDVALAFAVVAFLSTAILARVLEERRDDD